MSILSVNLRSGPTLSRTVRIKKTLRDLHGKK
jgi:hypothetical protein